LIISGFLVTSLWVIWPFQQRQYISVRGKQQLLESSPIAPPWETITIEASFLALLGLVIVIGASRLANRSTTRRIR